ncbi:hypothetical protein ZIOFF_059954 [Zingiber officinale]|uniref:EF-hand domain-containing protein n=1 Tax=Zingiber officinale TaxID=94328 RepID=A0A8J5FAQ5_ZINOF|nr:hypothetical protein ZIOFF_059954 [Zingiber officinale]
MALLPPKLHGNSMFLAGQSHTQRMAWTTGRSNCSPYFPFTFREVAPRSASTMPIIQSPPPSLPPSQPIAVAVLDRDRQHIALRMRASERPSMEMMKEAEGPAHQFYAATSLLFPFLIAFVQFSVRFLSLLLQPGSCSTESLRDRGSPRPAVPRCEAAVSGDDLKLVLQGLGLVAEWEAGSGGGERVEVAQELLEEKTASLAELEEAFYVFNRKEDGFISAEEVWSVMRRLGLREEVSLDDCRRMIGVFDQDGDGRISPRRLGEVASTSGDPSGEPHGQRRPPQPTGLIPLRHHRQQPHHPSRKLNGASHVDPATQLKLAESFGVADDVFKYNLIGDVPPTQGRPATLAPNVIERWSTGPLWRSAWRIQRTWTATASSSCG